MVGFVTDPSRVTGTTNNRLRPYHLDVTSDGTKRVRQMQGTAGFKEQGNFGRFRFDIKDADAVLHSSMGVTREFLVSLDDDVFAANGMPDGTILPNTMTAPSRVKANRFLYGQYWAPWPKFIFPETSISGVSAPQANFDCLAFLAGGWSLDLFGNGIQVPIPPLSPWPRSPALLAGTTCP